jgi:hypothetical protein
MLGIAVPSVHAQNNSANAQRVAQHATARHEALQELKLGDQAGALAKLRASVRKGARAPAEDTQVVGDLCSIAHQLAGEQHAAARSAAALAVSEANKARGQLPRREAAYVAAQAGFVLESVVGGGASRSWATAPPLPRCITRPSASMARARMPPKASSA